MALLNRLFNFNIESFIVFKEDIGRIDESILVKEGNLWAKEFHLTRVNIHNKKECFNLSSLWCEAYTNCPSIIEAEQAVKKMHEHGSLCFVAVKDNTYVGMLWLGDNNNFMFNRIGCFLQHEIKKSVYHHIYVSPGARGHNLQKALRLLALDNARKSDTNNIYAFVGCKNFSSIKNFLEFSCCYRLIYHIAIDIGPIKMDFHPKLSIENWVSH